MYTSSRVEGSSLRIAVAATLAVVALLGGCTDSGDSETPGSLGPTISVEPDPSETAPISNDANAGFVPIASDPDRDEQGQLLPEDCDGGEVLLRSTLDATPIEVREDDGGEYLCVDLGDLGVTAVFFQSDMPAVDQPNGFGQLMTDAFVINQFVLPPGYATNFAIEVDESSAPFLFVRGRLVDGFLLIEPIPDGDFQPTDLVERSLRLVSSDGTELTSVSYTGLGEPRATYEEFAACAADNGVTLPPSISPGAEPSPRLDLPIEVFRTAWEACKDLFFEFASSQPDDRPEHKANFRAIDECLADADIFQSLNQLVDPNRLLLEFASCHIASPAVVSLVECLRANGLDPLVNDVLSPGPFDAAVLQPAWDACRDAFAIAEFGPPIAIANGMPRLACFIENGYVRSFVVPRSYNDPMLLTLDNETCAL